MQHYIFLQETKNNLFPMVGTVIIEHQHTGLYLLQYNKQFDGHLANLTPPKTQRFNLNPTGLSAFMTLLDYGNPELEWKIQNKSKNKIVIMDYNKRKVSLTHKGLLSFDETFNEYEGRQIIRALSAILIANNQVRNRFTLKNVKNEKLL